MRGEQARSQTRRRRVLDAALEVFARDGYGDAAVDEIARASATSKGGVYFHFPSKQALFLCLLDEAAQLLVDRVERSMTAEENVTAKGDAALLTVLHTFGGHRTLARLLLVEALGAGSEFNAKLAELHDSFAGLIKRWLDEAVAAGFLPPLDTDLASVAWFGAVNQVVTRWVLTGRPKRLEDAYPTLRALLLSGVSTSVEEGQRQ
ncbi:MAG: TetR/AcrR family transcriptional regulator, fatty acid metabolism regulator protein [Thermomicrobiales bacterium]|nr:TetR/AcrR family transcriptional regulator, fatty acid metabolism regulator protein [Thermomicrobiales bacterium]